MQQFSLGFKFASRLLRHNLLRVLSLLHSGDTCTCSVISHCAETERSHMCYLH